MVSAFGVARSLSGQGDAFSGCLATRLAMMSSPPRPPSPIHSTAGSVGLARSRAFTRVIAHAEPHVRGGGARPSALARALETQAPAADDAAVSQPSWLASMK